LGPGFFLLNTSKLRDSINITRAQKYTFSLQLRQTSKKEAVEEKKTISLRKRTRTFSQADFKFSFSMLQPAPGGEANGRCT
jgi:hypothetical protein